MENVISIFQIFWALWQITLQPYSEAEWKSLKFSSWSAPKLVKQPISMITELLDLKKKCSRGFRTAEVSLETMRTITAFTARSLLLFHYNHYHHQ